MQRDCCRKGFVVVVGWLVWTLVNCCTPIVPWHRAAPDQWGVLRDNFHLSPRHILSWVHILRYKFSQIQFPHGTSFPRYNFLDTNSFRYNFPRAHPLTVMAQQTACAAAIVPILATRRGYYDAALWAAPSVCSVRRPFVSKIGLAKATSSLIHSSP